jgi:ribosomal protein S12 methylthiotransferase
VKEVDFDWMGAFGYSDQEGAGAFHHDEKIPPREIESRRKALMSIQKKISRAKKKSLIGREFDLLLEGSSTESDLLLEGRTAMHAPEIDGKVFVNDYPGENAPKEGEFYRCRVTAAHDYDLVAEII